MAALKLITAPATDPVTLTEAKAHLRVVDSDDDALIGVLIKSATGYVEKFLGRALKDQTWELYLDEFPEAEIQIPLPPLIEVVSIKYDDTAGVEQTVSSANYDVDDVNAPGWVLPTADAPWPSTLDAINSVRIRFRAGYVNLNSPEDNAVPDDIRAAILLTLGSFYEHREQVVVGTISSQLPFGVQNLLRNHRVLLGMA